MKRQVPNTTHRTVPCVLNLTNSKKRVPLINVPKLVVSMNTVKLNKANPKRAINVPTTKKTQTNTILYSLRKFMNSLIVKTAHPRLDLPVIVRRRTPSESLLSSKVQTVAEALV